ncbi:MAG TPA: CoA-binding protein [Desulfobacterales bacterium]|nr:CoA-binding protein [Desulfobacterales bacterium]
MQQCEIPEYNPPSQEIQEILREVKRIAVAGLSPKEERDSNKVARYLMAQGYEIVPVNPGQRKILGKTCYKSIKDIPFRIDMADLFLNPKRVPPVVDEAIEKGIPVIWMQLGVVHNEAAKKAREAGIKVIMNKCVKIEHQAMVSPSPIAQQPSELT